MSEVGAVAESAKLQRQERPRGATPRERSGAAAEMSYSASEIRVGGQKDQPHVQGAVAVQVQDGLEEVLHVQGQVGWW